MARVKIESIISHLDSQMRAALELTLKEHFPNERFDAWAVYRTFKKKVSLKCNTWERVSDNDVETD